MNYLQGQTILIDFLRNTMIRKQNHKFLLLHKIRSKVILVAIFNSFESVKAYNQAEFAINKY